MPTQEQSDSFAKKFNEISKKQNADEMLTEACEVIAKESEDLHQKVTDVSATFDASTVVDPEEVNQKMKEILDPSKASMETATQLGLFDKWDEQIEEPVDVVGLSIETQSLIEQAKKIADKNMADEITNLTMDTIKRNQVVYSEKHSGLAEIVNEFSKQSDLPNIDALIKQYRETHNIDAALNEDYSLSVRLGTLTRDLEIYQRDIDTKKAQIKKQVWLNRDYKNDSIRNAAYKESVARDLEQELKKLANMRGDFIAVEALVNLKSARR